MAYTAFVIDSHLRGKLLDNIPPMFPKVIAHHITVKFGVPADAEPPEPAKIQIVGMAVLATGLQALVCSVDGVIDRPDGSIYHITWSLDPKNHKPVDSNSMLKEHGYTKFPTPIAIRTSPVTLE